MENNITNQGQPSSNKKNLQVPAWEKPILYKEDWLNTLSGPDKGDEGTGKGNKNKRS